MLAFSSTLSITTTLGRTAAASDETLAPHAVLVFLICAVLELR